MFETSEWVKNWDLQKLMLLEHFRKESLFPDDAESFIHVIFWMNRAVALYMIHYVHDLPAKTCWVWPKCSFSIVEWSRLFILGAIMSLWFLHISHCSTAAFKQLSIALTFRPVFQCDCKVPWCNFLIRWFLLFREKGLSLGFCW